MIGIPFLFTLFFFSFLPIRNKSGTQSKKLPYNSSNAYTLESHRTMLSDSISYQIRILLSLSASNMMKQLVLNGNLNM